MSIFEAQYNKLNQLLLQVLNLLTNLNDDNFNANTVNMKSKIREIREINDFLRKNCHKEELDNINKNLLDLTKQIKLYFDNVIRNKESEALELLIRLKSLQNSKKLAVYER